MILSTLNGKEQMFIAVPVTFQFISIFFSQVIIVYCVVMNLATYLSFIIVYKHDELHGYIVVFFLMASSKECYCALIIPNPNGCVSFLLYEANVFQLNYERAIGDENKQGTVLTRLLTSSTLRANAWLSM